jgi:hypothetical protein
MDTMALNYNPLATIDDGSCIYTNDSTLFDIYGCMDSLALNYDPLATIDDGSCIYTNDSTLFDIYGCMDPLALNYNPIATIDDGSCIYVTDSLDCEAYFYISDINTDQNTISVVNQSTGNAIEYLWDFGDGNTSTDEYPTHTYDIDGLYVLCLTVTTNSTPNDSSYCVSYYCDTIGMSVIIPGFAMSGFTLNIVSEASLSIEDENRDLIAINLYPNPANEIITLNYTLVKSEKLTTTIYDISGRVMKTWTENSSAGQHSVNIDINDLSPGLYQIELRNNNARNVIRFQVIN